MITGTYNLEANPSWSLLQFQEVRLECDTTSGPVTINLPSIAKLSQSTNLKLIIVDATANASSNNITINSGSVGAPPVFDTFDDSTTTSLILDTDGSSVAIQNVSSNQWIATESIGGGGAVPSTKGQIVNVQAGVLISSPVTRVFTLGSTFIDPLLSFTGTTTETVLASLLIPKNTIRVGDYLNTQLFRLEYIYKQVAGGLSIKFYYNTTLSLIGATATNTTTNGSTGVGKGTADFQIVNAVKDGKFTSNTNYRTQPSNVFPVVYNDYSVFDITQDIYLIATITLNNSADEIVVFNAACPTFFSQNT